MAHNYEFSGTFINPRHVSAISPVKTKLNTGSVFEVFLLGDTESLTLHYKTKEEAETDRTKLMELAAEFAMK